MLRMVEDQRWFNTEKLICAHSVAYDCLNTAYRYECGIIFARLEKAQVAKVYNNNVCLHARLCKAYTQSKYYRNQNTKYP